MATRTLDSLFWDDEKVATLSFSERLLYACMFTDASLSDDYGCLPASARTLKKHAFGYDDGVTTEEVEVWRDGIIAKMGKSVLFYRVDDQHYIFLANFVKWQQLRYQRKSNTPKPNDPRAIVLSIPGTCAKVAEDCENFPLDRIALDGIEEDRDREIGGETPPAPPPPEPEKPARKRPARSELVLQFHEHTKCWLNTTQETAIAKTVPVETMDRFWQAVDAWMLHGYKPNNIKGMLDWYRDGVPDKSNGKGSREPPGSDNARDLEEWGKREGVIRGY